MTEQIIYIACDGMEFTDKEKCAKHEARVLSPKKFDEEVNQAIAVIREYCADHNGSCQNCRFFNNGCYFLNDYPHEW